MGEKHQLVYKDDRTDQDCVRELVSHEKVKMLGPRDNRILFAYRGKSDLFAFLRCPFDFI